jgi:hypothetical protein
MHRLRHRLLAPLDGVVVRLRYGSDGYVFFTLNVATGKKNQMLMSNESRSVAYLFMFDPFINFVDL